MVATTKTKSPRKQKYPQAVTGEDKPKVYCKQIELKTDSQKAYVAAINDSDIVICKGPAGTGKTFIAIYAAVNMLVNGKVDKIILTRPVVEAGEKLGFLPGDLNEKIDPFMIPLWDSLEYFLGPTKLKSMKEEGFIEVSPLAYQRGRTFRNCAVVLDECQNASQEQVKMCLTRIGPGSKIILSGDTRQSDLINDGRENALEWAHRKLTGVHDKIQTIEFSNADIVRHYLISIILNSLESKT